MLTLVCFCGTNLLSLSLIIWILLNFLGIFVSNHMEEKKRNDVLLVNSFQEGNEKAFNDLVSRYRKRIFDMILKMVRNREDAKDLTQETFVKVYLGLKNFKRESSFFTWVTRIAINLCINFRKRERFRSFVSFFDLKRPLLAEEPSSRDGTKDELSQAIDAAVLSLPPKQRTVFVLRYYQRLPFEKIAEILGKSEGGSKANYFQAIKKLKRSLARYRTI